LSTTHGSSVLPYAIKYLFDFLDDQAAKHSIKDLDVVYTWKSNSLPLRFWVNLIKNPEFLFDVHKSHIVDASLSVIASAFIDSFSQSKIDYNKESPSNKLLFNKEVAEYRNWVQKYYSDIKDTHPISQNDLNKILVDQSKVGFHPINRKTSKLFLTYSNLNQRNIKMN
jgi:plexin A